jgi:hypothetical protein
MIKKRRKLIIITITVFFLYCFGTIYMPGFKGRVLDKETGKPIKNAYIICFTDYYPFNQIGNVGGPNSENGAMQVSQTDEYGYFYAKPYLKISAGLVNYRRVYIFKEGYLFAKEYYQYPGSKRSLVREAVLRGPEERKSIFLNKVNDFYLSAFNADIDIRGNPFPNGFLGALWDTEGFLRYYKGEHKRQYRQLKPLFIQLYKIFNTYSEEIKKTLLKPHRVDNWEFQLKSLRNSLEIGKTN